MILQKSASRKSLGRVVGISSKCCGDYFPQVKVRTQKGTRRLAQSPPRIRPAKFLICGHWGSRYWPAHKQKFLMRSCNRTSSSYNLPFAKDGIRIRMGPTDRNTHTARSRLSPPSMTGDPHTSSQTNMTPDSLCRGIQRHRVDAPITEDFELALKKRGVRGNDCYKSQKDHWVCWLSEYGGPGAYRRKPGDRSAKFAYNRIQCAPMLVWLAEASGVPRTTLRNAVRVALSSGRSSGSQCASIRRIIPWEVIERLLSSNVPRSS